MARCAAAPGSVVVLRGFTCNGELADELIPPLIEQFPRARQVRFVFLTAPTRSISCYGEPQELNGWHDYFTDHGGAEGRPDIEEEIDVGQLEWSAAQVHKVMDAEAALLGDDDLSRVALLGQSQGSCTSLHCALTHRAAGGLVRLDWPAVSHTPVPSDRKEMPMFMFNGAADIIALPRCARIRASSTRGTRRFGCTSRPTWATAARSRRRRCSARRSRRGAC